MYVQNYISSNTKNPKDHRINHTPGHNLYKGGNNQMISDKAPDE